MSRQQDQDAAKHGWSKLPPKGKDEGRMSSYRNEKGERLNVFDTTGTVATTVDHPRQGRNQMFRKDNTPEDIAKYFENPRVHTDRGYHSRNVFNYNLKIGKFLPKIKPPKDIILMFNFEFKCVP